ncbi:MAG: metallophosphoesterase family protein, partial [Thermoguttaceae bacterium]
FVDGNMDNAGELRAVISAPEHTFHDQFGSIEIEGRRVAFLHGNDVQLLHHTIHSGEWDLVCHGHTHAFANGRQNETVVLNPGALTRTPRPSMAVVELPSLEVTEIAVEEG